jgi:uncharacterized membrane protein
MPEPAALLASDKTYLADLSAALEAARNIARLRHEISFYRKFFADRIAAMERALDDQERVHGQLIERLAPYIEGRTGFDTDG